MKKILVIFFVCLFGCNTPALFIFTDFEEALRQAKSRQTDVFVIFDLWGSSTNYVDKLLENRKVKNLLRNYVVARLRCDDKRKSENGQTLGGINSNLQTEKTGLYVQPLFCFFDSSGGLVGTPRGYSPENEIIRFLKNHRATIR